ncbi:MAG: hypothetical protein ABJG86_07960 [Nitratireductor sp.]|jgi:hypothetical protein|uniref:hypothetical protein n=1 Tax=Parvibaculum sp. TaxID=2024848 RepID=UPI0032903E74
MIWNLSFGWLLMAVGTVCILSFIFALALNAIIGRDGFGPFGTMVVLTGGFFASIYAVNAYGISLRKVQEAAFAGLGGAFVILVFLLLVKGVIRRI